MATRWRRLMRAAGFRYVFLGIENVLDEDLAFLKAAAKNDERSGGRRVGNATLAGNRCTCTASGMFVVGGIIVGSPDDTSEAIEANLAFARQYVDWPYIQHPTPYPRTPMTPRLPRARPDCQRGARGVRRDDGPVVRTTHLRADDVEFMRWKAERWMKVRHIPAAPRHDPWFFVLTHAPRMFAHTFRGSSWRSILGFESAREVFHRYQQIRRREREYLPVSDPLTTSPSAAA